MRSNQWVKIDWNLVPFEQLSRQNKRERLFKEANYACPECGFNKRRADGHHVLEIDHIDGNHKNESRNNLRVLCPNCHALTPNFRNWGRSKTKTSTRFRKGNTGFDEARKLQIQREKEYEEWFKRMVLEAHVQQEIDFSKHGWVQRLSEKLDDGCAYAVMKRVRRLMPEFFATHCRTRAKKQLEKQHIA